MKETKRVDDIECPYCGHIFDGGRATNYDTTKNGVECPSCGKEIYVMQCVEYTAQTV